MGEISNPTIRLYNEQHKRALECAAKILTILSIEDEIFKRAQELRILLAQLAGTLRSHFMSEDTFLYPSLIDHSDPSVSATAKRFWNEMGGVSQAVVNFLDTWTAIGAIESRPAGFAVESRSIMTALQKRIDAEESELYPLYSSIVT